MSKHKLSACHSRSTPATDKHCTPQVFFKYVENKLGIKFSSDVAADSKNTLCKYFIDAKQDSLKTRWRSGTAWCNPPYSKVGKFVDRGYQMATKGIANSVFLVAPRTDREWWKLTQYAYKVIYIKGRLKFKGLKGSAPFPSVLIIFTSKYHGPPKVEYWSPTPYERGFDRGNPNKVKKGKKK